MAFSSPRLQEGRPLLRLAALALLALLALALSACIPRSRPEPPPPAAEPERVPEPEPEPEVPLPPDESRNRVAVLVPLSGENGGLGRSILNAANLALLDAGGERIRITAYDTARGAGEAANSALAEGNGLILGPLLADDVRAVAPIARRARVPVVAFSNDVSVAGDGVYIMGFNPAQSIARVVGHARTGGAERFGALVPNGVYGQRAGQAMIEAVEGADARLVGMQNFDRSSQSSLRAAAARLAEQGRYDSVLIADGVEVSAFAAPAVLQGPAQPRILGTELWAAAADIERHEPLRGAWFAAPSDTMFGQFRSRYRARYRAEPYRLASLGYDAVLLAMRAATDWPLGRPFPRAALADPTGFIGVDGAFRFGRDGVAERALEVREVTATGTTVVSPAPRGFD